MILKEYIEERDDFDLNKVFNNCLKSVNNSYYRVKGTKANLENISVMFDDNFKEGKIGAFIHPKDGVGGKILIKNKALEHGIQYIKDIITHELIHASLGYSETHSHDGDFTKIAEYVGLPKEYWD